MKKRTSILLFKLWIFPPIILLGSYFAVGLALSAFGLGDELLQFMRYVAEHYGGMATALYYGYVVIFYTQMVFSIPFFASVIYFRGGFAQIAGEKFNTEMVKNSRFMFWDEIVDQYSAPEHRVERIMTERMP